MRKFRLRKIFAAAGALLLGFNIFLAQADIIYGLTEKMIVVEPML